MPIIWYLYFKLIIINNKLKIEALLEKFKHQGIFTTRDVRNFYAEEEPKIPNNTVNWRIYKLVQSGIISRVGRGKYIAGAQVEFKPFLGKKEISITDQLEKHFPFSDFSIWTTDAIQELYQHYSRVKFIIVEVDRDSVEAVFHFLKDNYSKVYLKPTQDMVENLLLHMKDVIVIQNLISQAPLQEIQKTTTVTLEKLLVDLFCEKNLFFYLQGSELQNIFQRAFEKYTINESKLLRYADRRKKKDEIREMIISIKRH